MNNELPSLTVVGTPIGNMSDISQRAIDTLEAVDFVIAEDTRVTGLFLNKLGIKKPLMSCHKYSEEKKSSAIIKRLSAGEKAALVSDAGMPLISDPGAVVVKHCIENGIDVSVVPSCTAADCALVLSGLDTSRYIFEGFLPSAKKDRQKRLNQLKELEFTLVFYEAPHRICETLMDMQACLGDRKISVSREITKLYEQTIRGCISEVIAHFEETAPRGEFVIVVSAYVPISEELTLEQAVDRVQALVTGGVKLSVACKQISSESKYSKSELYQYIVNQTEG